MTLTTRQEELVLALVPKLTGPLGALGSLIIIYEIAQSQGNPMLRALLGMSVFYLFDALAWFLSSWMTPSSSSNNNSDYDYVWAVGNVSTCAFQGFWLQAVIAGPLYNTVMALYFYLVSCHGSSLTKLCKLEPFLHAAVLLVALGTAFSFLQYDLYNPIGNVCWVNGSPPSCGHSIFEDGDPEVPCERGDHAWFYGMLLFYTPLWLCIGLLMYFNIRIYVVSGVSDDDAKWVAQQAFYYFVAFCLTWTPSTIWSARHYKGTSSFRLDLAAAICEPLAGFWNLLIFLSNRPSLRAQLLARLYCCSSIADGMDDGEENNSNSLGCSAEKTPRLPEQPSSFNSTHRVQPDTSSTSKA